MQYPTIEEVESASHTQLATWHIFLHRPGWDAIGKGREVFDKVLHQESDILARIDQRFKEMGGMTPKISKSIAW